MQWSIEHRATAHTHAHDACQPCTWMTAGRGMSPVRFAWACACFWYPTSAHAHHSFQSQGSAPVDGCWLCSTRPPHELSCMSCQHFLHLCGQQLQHAGECKLCDCCRALEGKCGGVCDTFGFCLQQQHEIVQCSDKAALLLRTPGNAAYTCSM